MKHVASFSGIKYRTAWKARVTDASAIPREWMVVNEQALQAFARSTKGAVAVAGVEFYAEKTMAAG